ncbi:MAG: DUF3108 domain-containing protein [Flavobacteriales bacterium]|nr:DUF3108 domain-containing protein [Flavobacteriales bacterium]
MKIPLTIFYFLIHSCVSLFGQSGCGIESKPFQDGEYLEYNVTYDWGFVTLNAGEVIFEVNNEKKSGKDVYHIEGTGRTYENYDWMYKVRDKYDTWVDTTDLSPNEFWRTADEGGAKYSNYYTFDRTVDSIYTKSTTEDIEKLDTLAHEDCLFDVLSLVYYCRTVNFDSLEINQKVPLVLILGGERTEIFIRYLGKEVQEVEDVGSFNTIKFSALLVEGSMFSGGEDMYIWLTDDKNRLPIRVQAEIWVGSVNSVLRSYKGLKYSVISKIED